MIKPDVIVTWPKNCDYPLWRQFLHDHRHFFENVIIIFMEANQGYDYSPLVRKAMAEDNCIMVDEPSRPASEDWRNHCVNIALTFSNSEWVWFTEQDFFPRDGFWEDVEKGTDVAEVVAVSDAMRMHPCCIFMKRSLLDKTSKDFTARPEQGYDHFGKLQLDLMNIQPVGYTIDYKTYKHYNGISQNYYLISIGQRPNYHERDFVDYLEKCLNVKVDQIPEFKCVVKEYLMKISEEQALLI